MSLNIPTKHEECSDVYCTDDLLSKLHPGRDPASSWPGLCFHGDRLLLEMEITRDVDSAGEQLTELAFVLKIGACRGVNWVSGRSQEACREMPPDRAPHATNKRPIIRLWHGGGWGLST